MFELMLACAHRPMVIEEIIVKRGWALIRRGPEDICPDSFDASTSYGDVGRELISNLRRQSWEAVLEPPAHPWIRRTPSERASGSRALARRARPSDRSPHAGDRVARPGRRCVRAPRTVANVRVSSPRWVSFG